MNGIETHVPRPAREEQALREVGRTAVSRPVAAALSVLFLATAFGVLAAEQIGVALRPEADLWPGWGAFRGQLAEAVRDDGLLGANRVLLAEVAAFEERLDEGSLLVEHAVPWAQWAETAWLGTGNRRAYVGPVRDGEWWLFYRPDVAYVTGPPFLAPEVLEARRAAADSWEPVVRPDPRPAILAFRRQLAERGIDLVVVPTPVKPSIHPERLAGEREGWEVPLQNRSFETLVGELVAAGVEVFDPAPLLARAARETGRPQYLAADTHWTPEALDRVAEALGWRLADVLGGAPEAAPAAYYRQPVRVRGVGDLARMLRLPEAPGLPELFPPQEVTVQQVLDPLGSLARPDSGADVLLLGDSFTNVYSQAELGWGQGAGLAEQLAYRLGRPVDRIAVNAGGSHTTRERLADLLRADPGRLDGKEVVVYQFAVRELSAGDWKLIDLPPPTRILTSRWSGRAARAAHRQSP
jgi:alginate O-acetyltransferase complex protein AlgJ